MCAREGSRRAADGSKPAPIWIPLPHCPPPAPEKLQSAPRQSRSWQKTCHLAARLQRRSAPLHRRSWAQWLAGSAAKAPLLEVSKGASGTPPRFWRRWHRLQPWAHPGSQEARSASHSWRRGRWPGRMQHRSQHGLSATKPERKIVMMENGRPAKPRGANEPPGPAAWLSCEQPERSTMFALVGGAVACEAAEPVSERKMPPIAVQLPLAKALP